MPILTKPAVAKNAPAEFTLNKSLLAAHTLVALDPYFSDSANWKTVVMVFESSTGSQNEKVIFDVSDANNTPTAEFLVSEHSRDIFGISFITIYDYDGGHFTVLASNLESSEYIIDTTPLPSFYSFTSLSNGVAQNPSGYVYKATGSGDLQAASSTVAGLLNGSFAIEYELKDFNLGMAAWIYLSSSPVIDAGFTFGIKLNTDGSISFKQPTGATTLTGNTSLNGTTTELIKMTVSGGSVQVMKNGSVINNFALAGVAIDSTPLYPYILLNLGGPYDNVNDGKNLVKALTV